MARQQKSEPALSQGNAFTLGYGSAPHGYDTKKPVKPSPPRPFQQKKSPRAFGDGGSIKSMTKVGKL